MSVVSPHYFLCVSCFPYRLFLHCFTFPLVVRMCFPAPLLADLKPEQLVYSEFGDLVERKLEEVGTGIAERVAQNDPVGDTMLALASPITMEAPLVVNKMEHEGFHKVTSLMEFQLRVFSIFFFRNLETGRASHPASVNFLVLLSYLDLA